jgi:hypothetical protein
MPTVRREAGFVIKVNTRGEHNPPHVHVFKAGGEVRVLLGDVDTPPSYWDEKTPMATKNKVRAVLLVERYQAECLEVWSKFNGNLS